MAKKIIAANWKMNLMREEAISLFNGVKKGLSAHKETEIVVFPPSIYISDLISNHPLIEVGAQNFYFEEKSPYFVDLKDFSYF